MNRPEYAMELHLHQVQQLFNSLDPSPFMARDLDQNAEEFVVGWARELPRNGEFRLVIHLDECKDIPTVQEQVATAVRNYFAYRTKVVAREFAQLMREGRLSLIIGLLFLGGCLLSARFLGSIAADHPLIELASESLIIGGWVAMWRPMEIFLYEWWPLAHKRSIMSRLARMEVELRRAAG